MRTCQGSGEPSDGHAPDDGAEDEDPEDEDMTPAPLVDSSDDENDGMSKMEESSESFDDEVNKGLPEMKNDNVPTKEFDSKKQQIHIRRDLWTDF